MNADEKKPIGNIKIARLILFLENVTFREHLSPTENQETSSHMRCLQNAQHISHYPLFDDVWSIWWFPEIGVPSNHLLWRGFPLYTIHLGNSPTGNPHMCLIDTRMQHRSFPRRRSMTSHSLVPWLSGNGDSPMAGLRLENPSYEFFFVWFTLW